MGTAIAPSDEIKQAIKLVKKPIAMPELFRLIKEEPTASVRAILGHVIFVYIHPFMDGNGRTGGILMNAMLASGGYGWTVIPVEQRDEYMSALEDASVNSNIKSLTKLISNLNDH